MRVALFLATFLVLLAEVVISLPRMPVVYQRELPADVQAIAHADTNYAACLSTGECLLIDASSGEIVKRGNFFGMSFSQIIFSSNSLFLVGSPGPLLMLNASDLSLLASYNVLKQGELEVVKAVISRDSRYAVLGIKHRVQGYVQDKLVVVDLAQGKRLFERDYSSSDPLVSIFSLDRWGDFFVAEVLNTSCHLCELTDNMVEIYRFGPQVQRVARRQIGLTRFKVFLGDHLLLQRAEDNTLLVLSLPTLEVSARASFPPVRQAFTAGNRAFLVTVSNELWACTTGLECRKLGTVPPRSLAAAVGDYIVVFSIPQVQVYLLREGLEHMLSYDINWDYPPSPPERVLSSDESTVAVYPGRRILGVFFTPHAQLLVRVVEEKGRPVADAIVTALCQENFTIRTTGADGYAVFKVSPGRCTLRVAKEGFSEWSTTLDVNSPLVNVSVVLSKIEVPTITLTLTVVDDETGTPVAGATIDLKGYTSYRVATDISGSVRLRVPLGNYTVEVTAPGYLVSHQALRLSGYDQSLSIRLKPQLSSLLLNVVGGESAIVKVGGVEYRVNGSMTLYLRPGEYSLSVSPPCRASVAPTLTLNSGRNFSVTIECRSLASGRAVSLSSLTSFLKENTITSRSLNVSMDSLTVQLLNSSMVDLVSLSYDRVVVVELFYTQCSGCKYLLPALKQIASWGNASVYSLTVSPLDDAKALSYYVRENNVTWPVGWALSEIRERINVTSYPTVFILSEGRVVFVGVGAKGQLSIVTEQIRGNLSGIFFVFLGSTLSAESYPVMLFTLGLVLISASLAVGGRGGAEKQEKGSILNYPTAIPSFELGLHNDALETLDWPSQAVYEQAQPGS